MKIHMHDVTSWKLFCLLLHCGAHAARMWARRQHMLLKFFMDPGFLLRIQHLSVHLVCVYSRIEVKQNHLDEFL